MYIGSLDISGNRGCWSLWVVWVGGGLVFCGSFGYMWVVCRLYGVVEGVIYLCVYFALRVGCV